MGKGKKRRSAKQPSLDADLDDEMDNYEASESEEEFGKDEKILIENRRGIKQHVDEEEVFGIHSSSEDEEEEDEYYGGGVPSDMDSDIEGHERDSEDGLPDSKAWGKESKKYYNTDYVDKDFGGMSKEDEELADMEEEEAVSIQKRLMAHLEETDFTLGLLDRVEEKKNELAERPSGEVEKEKISKDLSKMTQQEKIQLLKRESPELFQLIDDFKENMSLARNKLLPMVDLVEKGKIQSCPAADFIKTLTSVIMNYSTNIVFYLVLKSKRSGPVDNHPVINRLYTYKKVMDEMTYVLEDKLMVQIDSILKQHSSGEVLKPQIIQQVELPAKNRAERRKRQLKILEEAERTERLIASKKAKLEADKGAPEEKEDILSDLEDVEIASNEEEEYEEEDEKEGKRRITYEMKKNKGLTARRKKEDRNPRVKNKNKYKKAVKRRKGQVRLPRTETTRYGGEMSGIKSYLSKSVKIKV